MADQSSAPQVLSWGRDPKGRFFIQVLVQSAIGPGQVISAPIHVFVLTQDEEDKLLASLGGITVAHSLDNLVQLNGHKKN